MVVEEFLGFLDGVGILVEDEEHDGVAHFMRIHIQTAECQTFSDQGPEDAFFCSTILAG